MTNIIFHPSGVRVDIAFSLAKKVRQFMRLKFRCNCIEMVDHEQSFVMQVIAKLAQVVFAV
jgi:hypothetical protein